MQTVIHSRSGFYNRVRWCLAAMALAAGLAATPAFALVYQDTDAQSAGLGAGHAFLDGEARLSVGLSSGGHDGCSGSLVGGGAFVLTAAHCFTDDSGRPIATSIDILFGNSNLDVTATHISSTRIGSARSAAAETWRSSSWTRPSSPYPAIDWTRRPPRSEMS